MGNEPQEQVVSPAEPAAPEPPAEPGMRNTVIVIAGLIAVAALLAVLLRLGDEPAGSATPPPAAASYHPAGHTVTYEASGEGTTSATYTIRSDDGGTRQGDTDLPMMNKTGGYGLVFTGFGSGAFVYISVQNASDYGSVTCKIIVDGQTISENTSTGGFTIATCSSQVP